MTNDFTSRCTALEFARRNGAQFDVLVIGGGVTVDPHYAYISLIKSDNLMAFAKLFGKGSIEVNRILYTLILVACGLTQTVRAQSTDQSLPTPVLTNDINGKIAALDVGDPRATRHFYAFAGSPGDLLITVDSKNLDGDIDVFTAITFRPLMKTTIYATSRSAGVTKGIYLRAHQLLILRIEARTPN